jgi:hypothetical protein
MAKRSGVRRLQPGSRARSRVQARDLAALTARAMQQLFAPKRAWGMPRAQCTRSPCCIGRKHTAVTTGPPERPEGRRLWEALVGIEMLGQHRFISWTKFHATLRCLASPRRCPDLVLSRTGCNGIKKQVCNRPVSLIQSKADGSVCGCLQEV